MELKQILADFEDTAGKLKYRTDFMLFIKESSEEDFYRDEERITVSTIHKSKGREFDHAENHSQIVSAEFKQDSIVIKYPQIDEFDDETEEKAINELIKNDILDHQVEDVMEAYQEDGSTSA